jgi:hypothetical protein
MRRLRPLWRRLRKVETLRDLVHACDLRALDVVRAAAWRLDMLKIGEPLDTHPVELTPHIEVSHPPVPREGWLTYLVALEGQVTRGGQDAGKVEVTVRLAYEVRGKLPPDALMRAFGFDIATHHAWPYLRERAHTLATGIGLHLPPLPMRRLSSKLE